jgi:hypothetical protein
MSQVCINYNCQDELGAHLLNNCGYERQGGASQVIFIECGSTLSTISASAINSLVTAGNATIVKNINISYDYASPVEVEANVPCQPSRVVNYNREGTFIDRNVNSSNVNFYNDIFKGRKFAGMLIFECGNEDEPKVKFIDAVITITGSDRLPNNNNEFQDFKGTFKWQSLNMPSIHDKPVGINGID